MKDAKNTSLVFLTINVKISQFVNCERVLNEKNETTGFKLPMVSFLI